MKKIIMLIILSITLFSCNRNDNIISIYLEGEIENLKTLNKIQSITNDTVVIRHIDSLKLIYYIEAIKSKEFLKERETILEPLDDSKKLIDKYIKLIDE